jgi:DNA-binding MarR family transcriptional regulator
MKTICAMRDVFKAMDDFEHAFEAMYKISLNEAMILCTLRKAVDRLTATNLSRQTNLSPSHASKMLRILEEKKLIQRTLGDEDRRQMYFALTPSGKERVNELELDKVEIPELLRPLFED